MAWLDPIDYVQTIPRATMFGALYWTDQHDRILCLCSARNPSIWQPAGGDFDHGDITPFDTACREGAEETGIKYTGPEQVLLVHYLAESTAWPCPKIGFVYDASQLTDDQLGAIRLDPAEHTEHAVHSLEQWAGVLDEGGSTVASPASPKPAARDTRASWSARESRSIRHCRVLRPDGAYARTEAAAAPRSAAASCSSSCADRLGVIRRRRARRQRAPV
ncbi:NUDIX domain-containing protein [Streptacidiphilus neutrinimicus]|uniref:NUDIX domain-containing protein n=1 Tax=Streptacidiphilus neutrinimicus TaxID=105420 RepID=UPI000694F32C|nr:NUDIX hydrolase [Streptacidiphilus neutrinimicus]